MNTVFADSYYFLALLNEQDVAHERAVALSETNDWPLLTTAWVITEVADALAAPKRRAKFLLFLDALRHDPNCTELPASQVLFERGLELYGQRLDKEWSLTDCISFVAMKDHELTDALTGDRHFEQAGFRILLK
jgi:hypothetical protein